MDSKKFGYLAERASIEFLIKKGYHILYHSYRNYHGEIDIIAFDQDVVVFVEVKSRKSKKYGAPEEAVHQLKQRRILKVAQLYQQENKLIDKVVRFDVIAIERDQGKLFRIRHIKNAF